MPTKQLIEQINPVGFTARSLISLVAQSGGDDLAKAFTQKLNWQDSVPQIDQLTNEPYKPLLAATCIWGEYRLKTMNHMILETNYPNVLDLACGYTTRGVLMTRAGKNYVGGDLPSVIQEIAPVAKEYMDLEPGQIGEYVEVDVTNAAAMKRAADLMDGEICIVSDGLLGYLGSFERAVFCRNVYDILKEHGGCWLTQDVQEFRRFYEKDATIFDESSLEYTKQTVVKFSGRADVDQSQEWFINEDQIERMFADEGLLFESVPFYCDEVTVNSFRFVTSEKKAEYMKKLSGYLAWKITANPEFHREEETLDPGEFSCSLDIRDGDLHIALKGQLDTLTAPVLVEKFQEIEKEKSFRDVQVDMKKLHYISSAGLRALLIMKKSAKERNVILSFARPEVMDVLKLTGFDQLVTVV